MLPQIEWTAFSFLQMNVMERTGWLRTIPTVSMENMNYICFLPSFLSWIWLVSPEISCASFPSLLQPPPLTDSDNFVIPPSSEVEPHARALFSPPAQSLAGGTGPGDVTSHEPGDIATPNCS